MTDGGELDLGPLVAIPAPEFSLELTLGCGQVFHWRRHGAGWLGAVGSEPLYAEQVGDGLLVPAGSEALAARYFALDHPLAEWYATFPTDPAMQAALAACRGLRIIRQPAWECVGTFITSSMKQVAHIAAISHTLRERWGAPLAWRGRRLYAYPEPATLAEAGEAALRGCALGYRAPNLARSARLVADGTVPLEALHGHDDDQARAELCRLPGVGTKVANCALLFAYGRLRAFPIDVWIERVLRGVYFARRRRVTARQLQEFSATHFGPYGGLAQQYLFHHARVLTPRPPRPPRKKRTLRKPSGG